MTVQQQIEMGKTYRTRDGRRVELVSLQGDNETYPVLARISGDKTPETMVQSYFTHNGCYSIYEDSVLDLIEVKAKSPLREKDKKRIEEMVSMDVECYSAIRVQTQRQKKVQGTQALPALISMDKKYRTRDGRAVRVLAVDVNGSFEKVAAAVTCIDKGTESVYSYNQNGKLSGSEGQADLIEISPFEDMKIDDPVIVTIGSQGSVGKVFHFAGTTEDGRPKVWAQGRTSLTVKNKACDWWIPAGLKPYVAE